MSDSDQPSPGTTTDPASETERDTGTQEKTSVLRVMLGLTVIWGSLYLVAIAQRISFDESNVQAARRAEVQTGEAGSSAPRIDELTGRLDSPIESLEVRSIPARQIVKKLLYDGHLFAQPGALDEIPESPISLSLENVPLHSALSSAVAAVDMGFYLRAGQVGFFSRIVSDKGGSAGEPALRWEADIGLTPERTTIYVAEDSDIRVDLKVRRLGPKGNGETRAIEYVIRRNGEVLRSGTENLRADATEPVEIQPTSETTLRIGNSPAELGEGVLRLTFIYDSAEPIEPTQ